MRVLAITNMYPSAEMPASGVFVEQQINGLLAIGVQVSVVFIDRRTEGAMAYYRMSPRILSAIEKFSPDLVHVMYGGVMADQVTRQSDLPPTLITFHGSDLLGENLSGLVRWLISHYGVHCSRRAATRARGLVVVARHLLSRLPSGIESDKCRVIPCGIDLDRFRPRSQMECRQRLGWCERALHVVFASGHGDPVKRPGLAKAAVQHAIRGGVPAQLHYLTGIPNDTVPVWLSAANALLLTSLHEGSPTVVKEALACGLPVVSVDVGDVVERLAGIEGCHLAKPDPADLAYRLRLVWERGQRIDCGRRLQELSHMAVAHSLRRFYEHILAGDRVRRTPLPTGKSSVSTVHGHSTLRLEPAAFGSCL